MHLSVMHCLNENLELPNNFIDQDFIAHAAKWDGWQGQLFPLVVWVVNEYNDLLLPHVPRKDLACWEKMSECFMEILLP